MKLDPVALVDAMLTQAEAWHQEAIELPPAEQVSSGLLADVNRLRDAARCIERRVHAQVQAQAKARAPR